MTERYYNKGIAPRLALACPREAFYQLEYRCEMLWGFDRAMMAEILAYLGAGPDRDKVRRNSPHATRLMRLPKTFLAARARETLVAKIEALLRKGDRYN